MRRRTSALIGFLAVIGLGAGSGLAVSAGAAPGPLTGDWMLIQARDAVGYFAVENAGISLTVSGRSATGYAACGDYRLDVHGDGGDLALRPADEGPQEPVERCPAQLEEVRELYLAALTSSSSATVENRTLRLAGGETELVYAAVPRFPEARLTGTSWVLQSFGETWSGPRNTPLASGSVLRFLDNRRVSTSLACRTAVGFYHVVRTEATLVLHNVTPILEPTSGYCPRPAALQDLFVSEVFRGFRATVQGDRLTLTRNRLEVVYRALDAAAR